ncbi:hypothetical protein BV454_02159 [Bacillus altitudinis]|nr:hypothetical protein ID12_09965 [Bacillus altitudinis]KOA74277.1 hypothetical protein ACR53_16025 [Bacillus stratosphericus]MCL4098828.1 hypothetical protein [Bacillus altitudinis]QAR53551.1 hypothetical protein BAE_12445 [Bacillus aerophilus]
MKYFNIESLFQLKEAFLSGETQVTLILIGRYIFVIMNQYHICEIRYVKWLINEFLYIFFSFFIQKYMIFSYL